MVQHLIIPFPGKRYVLQSANICDRIWEKGPLHAEAEFLFLIVHNLGNFKAVVATGLKSDVTIL